MKWLFNEKHAITDYIFNKTLDRFYEMGVRGLVRENIQNSLDARIDDENPVIFTIKYGTHEKKDIPLFDDVKQHILSLEVGNMYAKDTIESMMEYLKTNEHHFISFEDENTKGLSNPDIGYPNNELKSAYNAYAYAKGLHIEDDDVEKEGLRGGSHGIGKIASNAASMFYMMFFANCDQKNYRTLGGNIQLIDHFYDKKYYSSTGDFVEKIDSKYFPIINEGFDEIFQKNTRGLKIIIPFFRLELLDKNEILRTVIDNFLLAILENKLIVRVNDDVVSSHTIKSLILDSKLFENLDENDPLYTKLYFSTISKEKPVDFPIVIQQEKYSFKLMLSVDENIEDGRTGIFRRIGMKIEDRKLSSYSKSPYNAVLVSDSIETDKMLKSLENESHTNLSHAQIKNSERKIHAKRFLAEINRKLKQIIDEKTKYLYPDTEVPNLVDILFEVNRDTKREMEKRHTVINVGNGTDQRTILKVSPTDDEGESAGIRGKRLGNGDFPYKRVRKTIGNKGIKSFYELPTSDLKRIVIGDKEIVQIKLKPFKTEHNECNLLVTIIDGMGQELEQELDLKELYKESKDINTGKQTIIGKQSFEGVTILNNTIRFENKILDNRSSFYKFKYYLEV